MAISESDCKKFKVLRELALERFQTRVLADAQSVSEKETLSPANRCTVWSWAVTKTLARYRPL